MRIILICMIANGINIKQLKPILISQKKTNFVNMSIFNSLKNYFVYLFMHIHVYLKISNLWSLYLLAEQVNQSLYSVVGCLNKKNNITDFIQNYLIFLAMQCKNV